MSTVRGMYLNIHIANLCVNDVVDTRLEIKIFRREWDHFGQPESEVMTQFETQFQPTFRRDEEVVWLNPDKSATYTTDGLAAHLIKVFTEPRPKRDHVGNMKVRAA